jgi:hypothetical protein
MGNFIERVFKSGLIKRLEEQVISERRRYLQVVRDLTEAEHSAKKFSSMYIEQSHGLIELQNRYDAQTEYYESRIKELTTKKRKK